MWLQDFHTRVDDALLGEDLAQLLYKVFKSGQEQEDEQGAARAAQSAVCKLEIKVTKCIFELQIGAHLLTCPAQVLHFLGVKQYVVFLG